ncbi:hypothetical protein LIER_21738 [Lithospermum erythrorhizon]|uniref:Uncharacterized protein n=1 Tax=Lithospermum erythrorhizon TaxID=34254 RepID=A0AAV3QSU8_LITER
MFSLSKSFTSIPPRLIPPSQYRHVQSLTLTIRSSSSGSNSTSNAADENSTIPTRPAITPPDAVEIRFRRGSRRRRKEQEEGDGMPVKAKAPPKDWDSMTLSEKAIELYVGEKGLLFWLNKFAYASIFIIIGGWILFRFVGPALNLYQLDTPPLEPKALFKGS